MKRKFVLWAIAGVASLYGVVSVVAAVVLEDTTPFLRATSSLSGALLVIAAWLLIRQSRSAVPFLWA